MYLSFNEFFSKQYKYKFCNNNNFSHIPYLTNDELIKYNDDFITTPYKKCNLKPINYLYNTCYIG